ncbi:hypothetical protein, partial [Thermogymnomonas acidicola]|uniref:hypothetical protein n=1 Tax=Thermogymnomonas acidicola TaxID=399579 RepID=UPI00166DFEA2
MTVRGNYSLEHSEVIVESGARITVENGSTISINGDEFIPASNGTSLTIRDYGSLLINDSEFQVPVKLLADRARATISGSSIPNGSVYEVNGSELHVFRSNLGAPTGTAASYFDVLNASDYYVPFSTNSSFPLSPERSGPLGAPITGIYLNATVGGNATGDRIEIVSGNTTLLSIEPPSTPAFNDKATVSYFVKTGPMNATGMVSKGLKGRMVDTSGNNLTIWNLTVTLVSDDVEYTEPWLDNYYFSSSSVSITNSTLYLNGTYIQKGIPDPESHFLYVRNSTLVLAGPLNGMGLSGSLVTDSNSSIWVYQPIEFENVPAGENASDVLANLSAVPVPPP